MIRTKYNAKKVKHDWFIFDSKIEYDYYLYLKELEKIGKIKAIYIHPVYILQPQFVKNNKKYREIKYVADFKVIYPNKTEIVDIKWMATNEALLKKKMFNYKYPNDILVWIVYIKKRWGRVEYDENKKMKKNEKKDKIDNI